MLKALKNKSISLLWVGQILSAVGDEVYKVAFTWLAVGLIGADTGYLTAAMSAALILVSLFGGKWADHWDHFRTLFWVDTIRGLLVLLPVIASFFFPLSLPLLCVVSVLVVGMGGLFDPTIQAMLPLYAKDRETIQAATGLMSTTFRGARMVGPAIIGLLTAVIPMIHFFTIDAFSFFISASTIWFLSSHPRLKSQVKITIERLGVWESLMSAVRLVRQKNPKVTRAMMIKGLCGGLWNLSYTLGIALLVKERISGSAQVYGWVMGSYGLGNLGAALYFGNRERKNPEALIYLGFLVLAVGFFWIAYSHTLLSLALATAFSAIGGPLNDLPFVDLVQSSFDVHDNGDRDFGNVRISKSA